MVGSNRINYEKEASPPSSIIQKNYKFGSISALSPKPSAPPSQSELNDSMDYDSKMDHVSHSQSKMHRNQFEVNLKQYDQSKEDHGTKRDYDSKMADYSTKVDHATKMDDGSKVDHDDSKVNYDSHPKLNRVNLKPSEMNQTHDSQSQSKQSEMNHDSMFEPKQSEMNSHSQSQRKQSKMNHNYGSHSQSKQSQMNHDSQYEPKQTESNSNPSLFDQLHQQLKPNSERKPTTISYSLSTTTHIEFRENEEGRRRSKEEYFPPQSVQCDPPLTVVNSEQIAPYREEIGHFHPTNDNSIQFKQRISNILNNFEDFATSDEYVSPVVKSVNLVSWLVGNNTVEH